MLVQKIQFITAHTVREKGKPMNRKETFQDLFISAQDRLPPDTKDRIICFNAIDGIPAIFFSCDARKYIQQMKKDEMDNIPFDVITGAKRITHWMTLYPPELSGKEMEFIKKKYHKKCRSCANYIPLGCFGVQGKCSEHIDELMSISGTCKDWEEGEK